MAVTSTAGTGFAISGIASGLDTDAIVDQLLELEKAPFRETEARKEGFENELSAWRSLNTRLLALDISVGQLQSDDLFLNRKASSSNEETLKVDAKAGKDLGNYSFTVESLAVNQQLISDGYSESTSPLDITSVSIQIGTALFDPIEIDDESRTLEGLRDAINVADQGVRASIIDAGESAGSERYKLMLTAENSGTAGEASFTFETTQGGSEPVLNVLQAADDAEVTLGTGVNAVTIESSTNSIDVFGGVSLELLKADPGNPVTVTLESNRNPVKSSIQNLLRNYNDVADFFNEQFNFNSETGVSGTLFGNRDLLNLQNDMVSAMTDPRAGLELNSLAGIGIGLDQAGHLAITDQDTFDQALEDPDAIVELLNDPDYGIITKLNDVLEEATTASIGTISNQEQYLQERITEMADKNLEFLRRLDDQERLMRREFGEMERVLSTLQSQSNQLSAQFGALLAPV